MTGNEARKVFIDYFIKHNHRNIRSSSLVPHDDPTLLFVNAGMVQFKRTFLGEELRNYTTAATSQKCVRAGGKHNDLENVGYTARHHTFFEMLGNFSFGDYFKDKAIEFSWDLLLNGYNLPKEKLYVSIFLDDDEAYDIWSKNIGVPNDRIIRLGEKDNFWSMGDTGPCGPCSEIHIDRGEEFGCGKPECKVGCDCDRFLEIWNLVFMQFNRDESGKMTPLPKPSIDTGMGLERIASVIQDVPTNFDTDLFRPIIEKVENLSGKNLGHSSKDDISMKVIADHSRAAAFLIGDGILPSNEGRGYVLRRIMRRAIRYGRNIDLIKPFLHETASVVFDIMESAYPELKEAESFITNVIKNEEIRFSETLDNGLKLLGDTLADIKAKGDSVVPGNVIFKLYDTYGFPVDIIKDVVRDENMSLDIAGFDDSMEEQRVQSRSVSTFSDMGTAYKNLSSEGIISEFTGYDKLNCDSKVLVIVENGNEVSEASEGSEVEIVTKTTTFYAEAGGQTGDRGTITTQNVEIKVSDTIKTPTGLIIHKGKVITGRIKKGDSVVLKVDENKRESTALNHTATHLLHTTLREILGDHVKQAGSYVSHDRLRFDFTHFSSVDEKDIEEIERIVNMRIRKNFIINIEEMDSEEAFKSGATALFEEKYGDIVRIVSISDFSKEFCGGSHTGLTGNIGFFKIIGETGIAAGVRRIEALTGNSAIEFIQKTTDTLQKTAVIVKEQPFLVPQKVEKILSTQKNLEKEISKFKSIIASKSTDTSDDDYRIIDNVKIVAKKVNVDNPADLRDLGDKFKDKIKSGVIVLGSVSGSKVFLLSIVTKDLTDRFHAGKIIKEIAPVVGGGGGGRPDMAQAGGCKPENLDKALERAYDIFEKSLEN
ncbi:MAG: alanine--tRNA ligase [Desulfobacterales bacterium]|nr:alanine--tRNA ligase [Desulfobacterales bacterium]